MAGAQPKKMLIMHILEILKKYTDEDHRLSQKEIGEILKNEYDMVVDRKSIKRNLMDLIDLGFEIEYSESVRMVRDKATGQLEESCFLSDFYLVRDFTDSELRLLIDSLLFSKHIPYSQCKELIGKLEAGLKQLVFQRRPEYRQDPAMHIVLSYVVYGAYYAFDRNREYGMDQLVEVLGQLSQAATALFPPPQGEQAP